MKRPGNLQGINILVPKQIKNFGRTNNFGMLPPRMGPAIPGPPSPSLQAPVPHPWQSNRIAAVTRRTCPTC